MSALIGILQLIRPHNAIAAALSTGVGFYMARGTGPPWLLIFAVSLAAAAGNTVNDVYDLAIDRVNKPGRPLPAGRIAVRGAIALYAILVAAAAALLPALGPEAGAWIAVWIVLLHWYSASLKRRYLAGNLLVAAVSASAFLLGARVGGDISAGIVPGACAFLFVAGRELIKDCGDWCGDRLAGARTVAVVSGRRGASAAAAALFVALAAVFPLPYFLGGYRSGYLLVILLAVEPILVVSAALSVRGRSFGLSSLLLKAGMFFGILAFALS
jgi:geranylgeranylglycerol-phosphate geranylgeranyltransferase